MDRRELLKSLGVLGVGSIIPRPQVAGAARVTARTASAPDPKHIAGCWLTPEKTAGPYYFNPNLVRQDITEGKTGIPLRLVVTVINASCSPISNVLVDIWHASKDGLYSGYNQPGGNTVGQTFLRGIQTTDATGVAQFDTIYPGWYPGRATHIHFKARLTSSTYVTSQFAFPDSINTAVYATPLYVARGNNPTTNASDMVFQSANPQYLLLELEASGGGYVGRFTIGINAVSTGVENGVSAKGLILMPARPNPVTGTATFHFQLPQAERAVLTICDATGRVIRTVIDAELPAGNHAAVWDGRDASGGRAPAGVYHARLSSGGVVASRKLAMLR